MHQETRHRGDVDENASPNGRSPAWTRDEIILVVAAVAANGWRELRVDDREVGDLSRLLRALEIHPTELRPTDFRGPGSVSRKTADVATAYSAYSGRPTKGGALTREVVQEFEKEPNGMAVLAR